MNQPIIRSIKYTDPSLPDALKLVWETFLEFEAPDYTEEGIQEFKNYIEPASIKQMLANSKLYIWGYFLDDQLIGMIATKYPCHISLLFVAKEFHRKGIARALFHTVLSYYSDTAEYSQITVNSSLYAAEAYHHLGFKDTDTEQTVNGIRYIPMAYLFR